MADFNDEYQTSDELTFPFRFKSPMEGKSWGKGEAWRFADTKNDLDNARIKRAKEELAQAEGEDEATFNLVCTLWAMSRSWTLKLPKTFVQPVRDSNGALVLVDGKTQTEPHPLAGKTMPLTVEWIRKLGDAVLVQAWEELVAHYSEQFAVEDSKSDSDAVSDPPATE